MFEFLIFVESSTVCHYDAINDIRHPNLNADLKRRQIWFKEIFLRISESNFRLRCSSNTSDEMLPSDTCPLPIDTAL